MVRKVKGMGTSGINKNSLTDAVKFKMCGWLMKNLEKAQTEPYKNIADALKENFGGEVTEANVRGLLRMAGIERIEHNAHPVENNVRFLARIMLEHIRWDNMSGEDLNRLKGIADA